MTGRQQHLDSLRGLAALIVVLEHYFAAFYPYTVFGAQGHYRQIAAWESVAFYPPFGTLIAGHLAVCLFFILSGYVLSYRFLGERSEPSDLIAAMLRRPIRLGGLVVFTMGAAFLLWRAGFFFHHQVADLSHSRPWFDEPWTGPIGLAALIQDLLVPFSRGRVYNGPLWTIEIELYGSLATFAFLLLFRASPYRRIILFALVIALTTSFYQAFALGVLLADIHKERDLIKMPTPLMVVLVALAVYLSSYPHHCAPEFVERSIYGILPTSKTPGGYPMLAAALLFVIVLTSERAHSILAWRALRFLGRISYGIYAIHFLVLGSVSSWLFLELLEHTTYAGAFAIVLASGLAGSVLLAYAATVTIDDWSIAAAHRFGSALKGTIGRLQAVFLRAAAR
jgi:peptidoglycan/LPS O-acetylase OafA/YrhL